MSGHPFTFPARPTPPPHSQVDSWHDHDRALAHVQASAAGLADSPSLVASSSSQYQSHSQPHTRYETEIDHDRFSAGRVPSSGPSTPRQPSSPNGGNITRHHLPSRLTTPLPLVDAPSQPVPIDNFAAPRSDSPVVVVGSSSSAAAAPGLPPAVGSTGNGGYMLTHRARGSSVSDVWSGYNKPGDAARSHQHMPMQSDASAAMSLGGAGAGYHQGGGGFDLDDRSSIASSQRRFTLGENDGDDFGGRDEKGRKRSANGAGRRRGSNEKRGAAGGAYYDSNGYASDHGHGGNKAQRLMWCLALLAIVGIAVGVGVGVSLKKRHDAEQANAVSEDSGWSGSSGSAASTADQSNSLPTPMTSLPTSTSRRPRSTATRVVTTPSATRLLTRPTAGATTPAGGPVVYSTTYAFAQGPYTTAVPVTYTIPIAEDEVQTREDGRLQFTQEVVLPDLRTATREGERPRVITSRVRFRVVDERPTAVPGKRARLLR